MERECRGRCMEKRRNERKSDEEGKQPGNIREKREIKSERKEERKGILKERKGRLKKKKASKMTVNEKEEEKRIVHVEKGKEKGDGIQ